MGDTDLIINWRSALKMIERKLEEYESKRPIPKILFVDDDENDIFLFERMLSKFYQQTTYCRDSVEAKGLLKSGKWDFVFLDYRMPKQSGLDVLKSLDAVPDATQFYIISGYPDSPVVEEVYKLGRVFVPKQAVTPNFLGTILRPKNE